MKFAIKNAMKVALREPDVTVPLSAAESAELLEPEPERVAMKGEVPLNVPFICPLKVAGVPVATEPTKVAKREALTKVLTQLAARGS